MRGERGQSDLKQGGLWGLIGYPLAPLVRERKAWKCLAFDDSISHWFHKCTPSFNYIQKKATEDSSSLDMSACDGESGDEVQVARQD